MKYEQYKYRKGVLGFIEVSFFRLFPSLSIIGATELGGETFLALNAYWFFLALPVIDTLRCILYWNKEDGTDTPFKKNWNRTYYTLRMVLNLLASAFIVAANKYGVDNLLMPGEALFIGFVVGLPAVEYLIKAFGGLPSTQITEHRNDKTEAERSIKNGILASALFTVMAGLSLLYFFDDVTVSHQPVGWFLLIIGNAIPVAGFAALHRDQWLTACSTLLMVGLTLLFAGPKKSLGLDHLIQTEVGIGLGLVLGGFMLSLGRMAYDSFIQKQNKDNQTTLIPDGAEPSSITPVPINIQSGVLRADPASRSWGDYVSFLNPFRSCVEWSGGSGPRQGNGKK